MAWTNIPNTDIDQDSPITQTLMTALRDNALFAWESTWHPYDMVYPGDGNDGIFWDHGVDGSTTSEETPNFADGFEYKIIGTDIQSASSMTVEIDLYGTSFGSFTSLGTFMTVGSSDYGYFEATILRPRETRRNHVVTYAYGTGSSSAPQSDAVQYGTTADTIRNARVDLGASMNGGTLKLYRRRCIDGT